jgi:hypothetical protein
LLVKNRQVNNLQKKKQFHNKNENERKKKNILKTCLVVKTNKHQR